MLHTQRGQGTEEVVWCQSSTSCRAVVVHKRNEINGCPSAVQYRLVYNTVLWRSKGEGARLDVATILYDVVHDYAMEAEKIQQQYLL